MFGSALNPGSLSDGAVRWATFESEAMPHVASLFRVALWLTRDTAEAEEGSLLISFSSIAATSFLFWSQTSSQPNACSRNRIHG